jgi:hypothetical protein
MPQALQNRAFGINGPPHGIKVYGILFEGVQGKCGIRRISILQSKSFSNLGREKYGFHERIPDAFWPPTFQVYRVDPHNDEFGRGFKYLRSDEIELCLSISNNLAMPITRR